ncbi:zf-HC2 domain-containing protein [bacterium]|nr:zf-HC2 domain-containing protein [bacterium]
MKCDDIHQSLVSLLYGELDIEESKQVHKHLKQCKSCSQVYKELQNTVKVLDQWKDIQPNFKYVFIHEPATWWIIQWARFKQIGWGRRLALGIPAIVAAVLVFLALLNFRVGYHDGEWSMAVSIVPERAETNREALFIDTLEQNQKETLLLVSQMIKESEYKQSNENVLAWANIVQNLEKQRRQDLEMINGSLENLQWSTEGKFYQTSHVLDNLIRLTSYSLESK